MMFDSEPGKVVANTSSPFTTHGGGDISLWLAAMLALEGLTAAPHVHVSRLILRASGLISKDTSTLNRPLSNRSQLYLSPLCYSIVSCQLCCAASQA